MNETDFKKFLIVLSIALVACIVIGVAYMATYTPGVLITSILIVVGIGGMWMTFSSGNIATSVLMVDGIQKGHQLKLGHMGYGTYPMLPRGGGYGDGDMEIDITNVQALPDMSEEPY